MASRISLVQLAAASAASLVTACGGNVGNDASNGGGTSNSVNTTGSRANAGGAISSSGSKNTGGVVSAGGAVSGGANPAGGSTVVIGGASAAGGATAVLRTCAACDATCCEADDCSVIGFAGCAGGLVDCGFSACSQSVCGTGLTGSYGAPNKCPSCIPTTTMADCQAAGRNCNFIPDGCGGLFSCGTCTAPDTCGGSGAPFVCGNSAIGPCANFCMKIPSCATGTDTVLHGTVWSPAGNPAIDPSRGEVPLPIPNATVYVPNGSLNPPYGLSRFTDGVGNGCDCSVQGPPLAIFPTGVDGTFTVMNVPAGVDIPLVIQIGKWRRLVTIPASQAPACAGRVELTAAQTRLPRRQAEQDPMDSIPLMAIATGGPDALECVLRKMGVEDSQFSNGEDAGNGRIRFYRQTGTPGSPGASCASGAGSCVGSTPSYTNLVASQASVDRYDALLFPCNGAAHDESTQNKTLILDNATNTSAYVNKGGRAFFTHFSYAWLYNQPPAIGLPWASTSNSSLVDTVWDTAYGQIDTSFPRGATFEAWLNLPNVNGLTNVTPFPYVTLNEVRRDLANPIIWPYYPANNLLYAQRWIFHSSFMTPPDSSATTGSNHVPDSIQHLTFDTPYGDAATTVQCGRVVFSSFHVTPASLSSHACIVKAGEASDASNCNFPRECGSTMENQEKILAYMLFDMMAEVCPVIDICVPSTCEELGVSFGQASDGCGHALDCNYRKYLCKVTCEQSCANQGVTCFTSGPSPPDGAIYYECPQPDGCGAAMNCYCKIG